MAWTKRQLILQAYEDAGLAAFAEDLDANLISSAVRKMDAMLAEWQSRGIVLGYPLTQDPDDSSPDADSNLPLWANDAVSSNLAVRLAVQLGKQVAPELKVSAKMALNSLLSRAAMPQEMQITNLPRGAGQKLIDIPFLDPADTSPVRQTPNGELTLGD